jgi:hypothetical protein
VPLDKPVTVTGEVPVTDAIPASAEVHVPPAIVLANVTVLPRHIPLAPVMAAGVAKTVKGYVLVPLQLV